MPDPKVRTRSSNQKFPSIDNPTITVYFTPNKSLFATLFIFMLNMGHFRDPVSLEHPIFYHIPHEFFAVFLPSKRGDNLLWLSPLFHNLFTCTVQAHGMVCCSCFILNLLNIVSNSIKLRVLHLVSSFFHPIPSTERKQDNESIYNTFLMIPFMDSSYLLRGSHSNGTSGLIGKYDSIANDSAVAIPGKGDRYNGFVSRTSIPFFPLNVATALDIHGQYYWRRRLRCTDPYSHQ